MTGDEWKGEDEYTRYWITMGLPDGGTVVVDSLSILAMAEASNGSSQTTVYIEGGATFVVDMALVDVLRMLEATTEGD